jgi:hypothetical protein
MQRALGCRAAQVLCCPEGVLRACIDASEQAVWLLQDMPVCITLVCIHRQSVLMLRIAPGLSLQGVSSLAASCAALCVQHCAKLQAAEGRETTVLDIGCGTGGCCFELAAR